MTETEIKSVDVWSLAKMLAVFGFVFGTVIGFGTALTIGLIITMVSAMIPEIASLGIPEAFMQTFIGIWFGMIASYTSLGFFTGILFGAVYNFVADKTGGIKFKN